MYINIAYSFFPCLLLLGDKITLPVSALEELNPQNALELGVFTFELSTRDGLYKTHASVLEFVAEEGTIGMLKLICTYVSFG